MIKTLSKLIGFALAGFALLLPALRGFYLLHHDPRRADHAAREFLLEASSELDEWADDHADHFPADLNDLAAAGRARQGTGIGHVWGGVLRAPLGAAWSNLTAVRAGALLDPWGTPYRYVVDTDLDALRLESWGPDREPGRGDPASDDLVLTKREGATAFSFLDQDPLW